MDGSDYAVTLIDAGAPVAVIRAEAIGLTGTDDADAVAAHMPFFAELRRSAARAMGLPDNDQSVPKVGIIGPGIDSAELNARMISMSAPHPAIGLDQRGRVGRRRHDPRQPDPRPRPRPADLSDRHPQRTDRSSDHRENPAAAPSPSGVTPAASSMPSSTSLQQHGRRPDPAPSTAATPRPPSPDRSAGPPPVLPLSPYQPSRHDGDVVSERKDQ